MERAPYFAETAIGAVLLIAIQFLSLPILIGGVILIGVTRFVLRSRIANPE